MDIAAQAAAAFQSALHNAWVWFNSLDKHEWIALLAVVAALGFLCMRGFSGRGNI